MVHQRIALLLLTVIAALLSTALCFPKGAPSFACKSLRPQHLGAPLTRDVEISPYNISASTLTLSPGGSTTVVVSSESDAPEDSFFGFLCAVSLLDDDKHNTVGTMATLEPDVTQTVDCSHSTPATGITHTSKEPKWKTSFSWTAPGDAAVDTQYKIRCVVVQTIQKCWNDFQINLTISSSSASTTQAVTSTTQVVTSTTEDANSIATSTVSLTSSTGSGLTTESVVMATTNSVQEPTVTPTTIPPTISTKISTKLPSSAGSGLENKSAQNASRLHATTTQSSFVTSTPSTSVGPLPVRDRSSSSRGRGPPRTASKIGSSTLSSSRVRSNRPTQFQQTTPRNNQAAVQRPAQVRSRPPVLSNPLNSITPLRTIVPRNQRQNNLPQEFQTDFSNTRQSQFLSQSQLFPSNRDNNFPQTVGAVNLGNQELLVFDLQDLIPFLGSDALSLLGLDSNNMINFNNVNSNANNFNRRPTSFSPGITDMSSRSSTIPSRIVSRFPSGSRFDIERQREQFVNTNSINRSPFSNGFNRNNEFSHRQSMRSSNSLNNQNNVQNTFNPRLSQSNNQFRFPQRRSRMIDLINSSSRIRAPTFNTNFF